MSSTILPVVSSMLIDDDLVWMVVVGFIIAFVLAFGIGANDVANSFGTSVGAKVLTLKQACILATIFETLGSVLLGAKVSETIRNGIIDGEIFTNMTKGPETFMLGQVSSLSGCCIWLLIATFFKVPVSGTHSIVGATIGYAFVIYGPSAVKWFQVGMIVLSWFVSPLLSGAVSVGIFFAIKVFILVKQDPLEPGLKSLSLIYGLAIVVNSFSIFYGSPDLFVYFKIGLWLNFVISFMIGGVISLIIKLVVVPKQRIQIKSQIAKEKHYDKLEVIPEDMLSGKDKSDKSSLKTEESLSRQKTEDYDSQQRLQTVHDKPQQAKLFSGLQILTAVFGSFAHGGNDVSNAIGPLAGLWLVGIYHDVAISATTPIWILLYGGVGISAGLWILGRRVIETLGEDLTTITPSSGVCIELGSALTVLIASNIGIPISTTHCKVGSVVAVGRFRSRDNVNWRIFINIIMAWVITVPASALISAVIMFALIQTL